MANIGDVYDHLDEVLHFPASFFNELPNILHNLVGLLNRIIAFDVFRIVKILRALATQPNDFTSLCHNRLTKVIIQILLRIRVFGIEFSDALMSQIEFPA